MPEIIGLVGYARSGKDSVAAVLADYGFQRISFADAIRDALYTLDPFVTGSSDLRISQLVDTLGWDNVKVQYPEIRRLLQVFGTEVAREQWDDQFWVNLGFSKMEPEGRYVITDVRFPNEADAVKQHGGELWRVDRPGIGPVNAHASDNHISTITVDSVIKNDGNLYDLNERVKDSWRGSNIMNRVLGILSEPLTPKP
jgi:hypothetical protein